MKNKFSNVVIFVLCLMLINAMSAFAFAPGDGVYDADSSDFYNAGRENNQRNSVPAVTQEFAELIAEKEATLYPENGLHSTDSYPSSYRVAAVVQYPQDYSYYCGPAAVKSVLAGEGNTTITQATLAGDSYLQTDKYSNTPWYITDGSSNSDYPVYNTLRAFTSYAYVPYPSGALGTPPTSPKLSLMIKCTTSQGHGVVANGESKASATHASHMPGYTTASNIAHWVAVDGYEDDGDTIWIVDPVSGSSAISWSANVTRYYSVTLEKFTAFVAPRGIFW